MSGILRSRPGSILLWTILVAGFIIGPAAAVSSMQYRMDAAHTGDYSAASGGILPGNQLLWKFPTGGQVLSSPAIVDGYVYAASTDGYVYAVNARDGTPKWKFLTESDDAVTPAVSGGVVYAMGGHDNFYAINAADGTEKWKSQVVGVGHPSPIIADGAVYAAAWEREAMYVIRAADGTLKYTLWDNPRVPSVSDGVLYADTFNHYFRAFNANDGTRKWAFRLDGDVAREPAVADRTVYFGSSDFNTLDPQTGRIKGYVYALNAGDGTLKWRSRTDDVAWVSPAVSGGVVYTGINDGTFYALNANDGAVKWTYTLSAPVSSSPSVADGVVYVKSRDGNLYAINAGDGTRRWTYFAGIPSYYFKDSAPAIADGVVYIGCDKSICAIGGSRILQDPYIDINPVSDKYVGDKFTITADTNLEKGTTVQVDVYSASFKPKSQPGDFSGATGTVSVWNDGTGPINHIRFNVDATLFSPGRYVIRESALGKEGLGTSYFIVKEALASPQAGPDVRVYVTIRKFAFPGPTMRMAFEPSGLKPSYPPLTESARLNPAVVMAVIAGVMVLCYALVRKRG